MNEHLTWDTISRLVVYACVHLLILFTATRYFCKRQPRRKSLLAGALIMVALASVWIFTTFAWETYARVVSGFSDKLRWVSMIGSLLFYGTLLLIAMGRRNQARRIAELEAIIRDRDGESAP